MATAFPDLDVALLPVGGERLFGFRRTMGPRDAALESLKKSTGLGDLIGAEHEGKVTLLAAVTPDLTARFKAGDLIRETAAIVGGKGGGRPDFAQAGGTKPDQIDAALALVGSQREHRTEVFPP